MPAHRRVTCRPRDSNPDHPGPEPGASAVGPERPGVPYGTPVSRCRLRRCASCVAVSRASRVAVWPCRCSLCRRVVVSSERQGSNLRPSGPWPDALPAELRSVTRPGRLAWAVPDAPRACRPGGGRHSPRRVPVPLPLSCEGRAAAGVRTPSCRVEAGCLTDSASAACLPGSPGGESFRAFPEGGVNGFAFNVLHCGFVESGKRAPADGGRSGLTWFRKCSGNGEAAWTSVSGGSAVSLVRVIHLAVREPGHRL